MDGPTAVLSQAERQQNRRKPLLIPAVKLSKVFGRSASQTPAQAASWDNLSSSITSTFILSPSHSTTTAISKGGRRKSQRVVSPQVVSSIVDSMYAYPVNRESNRLSLPRYQDKTSLHHKSSLGTVTSRICRCSAFYSLVIFILNHIRHVADVPRRSSESPLHQRPPPIKMSHSTRGHTSSNDFPSNNSEPELLDTSNMGKKPETQPGNSQDSGSTVRIVGRGGSGSRLRMVTSVPETLEINPPIHREQPALLSIVGRGGSGSRLRVVTPTPETVDGNPPLHWEPPASLPRLIHHGAGGGRSRQKPVTPAPVLLSRLRRRKQKAGQGPNSKGKAREHPISPYLSYQITNESRSTLSTIHFAGETSTPPPSFFPLNESIEHIGPDKISLPVSLSTSTFDSTAEDAPLDARRPSTEDFDLDESRSPSPEERRKQSMDKITRTLGNLPHNGISPGDLPGKKEFTPNPCIDDEPTKKDPKKVFGRANLSFQSMSSVFVLSPVRRRRDSINSHHSLSTMTDDLHQLNLVDDFSDSSSAYNLPRSPICFSSPPPTTIHPPNAATSNPYGMEVEQEILSASSSALSRSHSHSHAPRRRSELFSNHSHSASTSLSPHEHSTTCASSPWIYPPSDHREEAKFSTASVTAGGPQSWTGEWNADIDVVIKALRALR